MPRDLNKNEYQTIEQVLDFLNRIIFSAGSVKTSEHNKGYIAVIEKEISGLYQMLKTGLISIDNSAPAEIQALTDKNGIHINGAQNIFNMRGNLNLIDRENGDFKTLWMITAMLFHEKFHFDNHTGIWYRVVRRSYELIFGSGLLIFSTVVNNKTFRTLLWKEYQAYTQTYLKLQKLGYLLGDICRTDHDSVKCPEEHLTWHRDSMERQNPWSTYGNKQDLSSSD